MSIKPSYVRLVFFSINFKKLGKTTIAFSVLKNDINNSGLAQGINQFVI